MDYLLKTIKRNALNWNILIFNKVNTLKYCIDITQFISFKSFLKLKNFFGECLWFLIFETSMNCTHKNAINKNATHIERNKNATFLHSHKIRIL